MTTENAEKHGNVACARVSFRKQINSKIYIYLTTENAEKHGKARLREGEFWKGLSVAPELCEEIFYFNDHR